MLIRRWLAASGMTRDALAAATRFPPNTIDSWLDGKFRPEGDNLVTLARELSVPLGRSRDEMRQFLGRHFALAELGKQLAPFAGRDAVAGAGSYFSRITSFVHEFIGHSQLEIAERRDAFIQMVHEGARYERCASIVGAMRRSENHAFWRNVFAASIRDWLPWLQHAHAQAATFQGAIRTGAMEPTSIEEQRDLLLSSLSDFTRPPAGMSQADWFQQIEGEPDRAIAFFSGQGETLLAFHEFAEAAECLRHTVRLAPGNPHFRYRLGCALWRPPFEDPDASNDRDWRRWIVEAREQLWIAVKIAEDEGPTWHVPYGWDLPLVELGWIMLEEGRTQEALAHAEGLARRLGAATDRSAFLLGHARLAVDDAAGALLAMEECLRLNPRHQLAKEVITSCRAWLRGDRGKAPRRR